MRTGAILRAWRLGRVVDLIGTLRLLLVTFRPEFDPPWIGGPRVTALTINRLAERDIGVMIDCIASNKPLPLDLRQDIIERTDGIPLFVRWESRPKTRCCCSRHSSAFGSGASGYWVAMCTASLQRSSWRSPRNKGRPSRS
jgi:hypothetical protein